MARWALWGPRSRFWETRSFLADFKVLITSGARHFIGHGRFVIDQRFRISFSKLPSSMAAF